MKAYTRHLINALLARHDEHEYVFFYHDASAMGSFGSLDRVREMALPWRSRILWDQVAVPLAARRAGIDVLFNPKYSMALAAPCPTVWVCHGYNRPFHREHLPWADYLNFRFALPRYAARANAIIAVSETTREHVIEYMHAPPERVHGCTSASTTSSDSLSTPRRWSARAGNIPSRSASFFLLARSIRRRTSADW